jgi:hypothetical protein
MKGKDVVAGKYYTHHSCIWLCVEAPTKTSAALLRSIWPLPGGVEVRVSQRTIDRVLSDREAAEIVKVQQQYQQKAVAS